MITEFLSLRSQIAQISVTFFLIGFVSCRDSLKKLSELMTPINALSPATHGISSNPTDPLRDAAVRLEATFLSEMLKSAGLGKTPSAFGGQAGEDQFGSFLIQAQAEQIARSGGIGLAESLYHALLESSDDS